MFARFCFLAHYVTESYFLYFYYSAETEASVRLYGLVHLHVFLLEIGRPIPNP